MGNVYYRVPHKEDVDFQKLIGSGLPFEEGKCGSCGETIIYSPPALEMAAQAVGGMMIVCNRCEDFVRKATEDTEKGVPSD